MRTAEFGNLANRITFLKSQKFVGSRSFIVWINGHKAGKVKRVETTEFAVAPGVHSVAVYIDWLRSPPLQVAVGPDSRTELAIGVKSGPVLKLLLPNILAGVAAAFVLEILRAASLIVHAQLWLRSLLLFAVFVLLAGGYALVTSKFFGEYWAVLTLTPTGSTASQSS